jgi:hypothetical protein
MSSSQPPFPYFNGIEYNSAYFTSIDSGLTIAQGNAKYLQKTISDTATALETFNSGISTNTITATTATSAPTLFNNITTTNIQIGQGQTSGTLSIGNGSSRSGTLGIAQNTRGNVSIANNMTSGGSNIVTIGTNSLGTLNLKGATVKINETGSTGATEIGNSSSGAIVIYKPLTPSYTPGAITSTTIGYKLDFTALSLTLSPNVAKSIMSVSLTPGVWLLQATIQTPTPATYQGLCFSLVTNVMNYTLSASQIITDGFFPMALNISHVFSIPSTSPVYMVAIAGDMRTLTQRTGSATRLA